MFEESHPQPPLDYVVKMALCACVNSALLGYDTGVLSGALLYLRDYLDLSVTQIELLTSSMNFIAIPGCFLAGIIADAIGRTRTLFAASLTFLVGALLMAGANDYGTLFLGRSLIGVGVGSGLSIDPLYIAEIAPPEWRGKLTSYSETAINVGILSGYLSNVCFMWLPPSYSWRVMLAMGAIPPFIMMVLAVFVMPDTPRFYLSKGRVEEADAVLKKITRSENEAKQTKQDIKASIAQEKNTSSRQGWGRILCPDPILRRMLQVTLIISVLQQLCGVDVILYYAPIIMEAGGITSRLAQLGLTAVAGLAKVGVLFITMHYLDHKSAGRRPLMLLSYCLLAISTTIVAVGFGVDSVVASVLGIIFFCGAFSVGAGPICWLMNSEVLPLAVRARGMTLGCSLNRLASAVLQTVFLSMAEGITPAGAFMVLTAINLFGFIYLYIYMPETKNKTLEEMTNYFAKILGVKPPAGGIYGEDPIEMKGRDSKPDDPKEHRESELGGDSVVDAEERNDSVIGDGQIGELENGHGGLTEVNLDSDRHQRPSMEPEKNTSSA
eukprot:CAMPEP_0184484590 /NCGR_PEP_ID=MMETSP0113_2-20130426/6291_1 /TAXON_ID=91329 /ORGANISM="Norrisiella sphaerica, Strain BC52" /LENGTH=551 /DNA_ID=CAMNT_0026865639 /DNA_START=80 /DNA_END=1735 /DNA_ORIENTATION=-